MVAEAACLRLAGGALMKISRRRFLHIGTISGVAVWLVPLRCPAHTDESGDSRARAPTPQGLAPPGVRIDGVAQVTGAKIFARDMRAADVGHWPRQQSHAFLLRSRCADRIYEGFDLHVLGENLQPDRIVTAADLARDKVAFPPFYGDDILLPPGETPAYLGQAVAILIFHDFVRYRFARDKLQFDAEVLRFGTHTGPLERAPWGTFHERRQGGHTPFDEDVYSSFRDGTTMQAQMPGGRRAAPRQRGGGRDTFGNDTAARRLAEAPAASSDRLLVMRRQYHSQSIDTAALEPDNANCWYDPGTRALHMLLATQSPHEVAKHAAEMLAASAFKPKSIFVQPCHTVGYGSKEHCNVPFYGLVCALYSEARPVRYAVDRFEHFQTSLKRHAFELDYSIAVERESGLFQSFKAQLTGNGGGRANLSSSVVQVGAQAAPSIYYFPNSELRAVATASRAVDAGSARGYGTLQSMAATEMMVDEIASELDWDPIDLRLRNVLRTGGRNAQGAIPTGAVRASEVLQQARRDPLWTQRGQRKEQFEATNPNRRYGVGFACVQKPFGSASEAASAVVELTPNGRIVLRQQGVEIGTGMTTAQALICEQWLGRPADQVEMMVNDDGGLSLTEPPEHHHLTQEEQERLARNPFWTPKLTSPTRASNSAYYLGHVTRETARVVFDHGLWPAAMEIWSRGIGGGQQAAGDVRIEDARWVAGRLTAKGLQPLSLEELVRQAYASRLVTGAAGHGFNRVEWARASFNVGGVTMRRPLDALAVRYGSAAATERVPRRRVHYPAVRRERAGISRYSTHAALVELAVDLTSGAVELLSHHAVLECGRQLVPELISGQLQGGIAMGIGHALHEYLPLYEDGPGNGTWNFNRYHLPRAADVAVWRQSADILPPLSDSDPPKGIGEVVMIPIVPAIVNGIAHAIGHRFRQLPVTAQMIRETLET